MFRVVILLLLWNGIDSIISGKMRERETKIQDDDYVCVCVMHKTQCLKSNHLSFRRRRRRRNPYTQSLFHSFPIFCDFFSARFFSSDFHFFFTIQYL